MIGGMEVMPDEQATKRKKFDEVMNVVAQVTGVSTGRLMGRSRKQRYSESRHIAWLVVRKWCGMTLTEIAGLFGRDHSTVHYGVEVARSKVRDIKALQWVLESIEARLEEELNAR